MTNRVLVAFDGSEHGKEALEYALEEFPEATLLVLTVIDPGEADYMTADSQLFGGDDWEAGAKGEAQTRLERAREIAGDRAIETQQTIGRPTKAILETAETEEVDHIVLGSQGRTGLSRVLLGSVAETVLRRSPVPVTVVR